LETVGCLAIQEIPHANPSFFLLCSKAAMVSIPRQMNLGHIL